MDFIEPVQREIGTRIWPYIMPLFSSADPFTVMVIVMILCAPFGVIWSTITKVFVLKYAQTKL